MNADVHAAVKAKDWLFYGQVGRELEQDGHTLDSSEYWAGYQPEAGAGLSRRAVSPRLRDSLCRPHVYNRSYLGLAQYDQIYGVEVSHTRGRYLTQVSLGPGRAESVIDDDGRVGVHGHWSRAGRSRDRARRWRPPGLYRAESDLDPSLGSAGVAFGFAPTSRLTTWTQVDGQFRDGANDASYVLVNETSLEVYRGLWLTVTPQARVGGGARRAGPGALRRRHGVPAAHALRRERQLLPRAQPDLRITTQIFLAQLHLYL